MTKRKPYPAWICSDCGEKWGRRECGVSTWHPDTCSLCGKEAMVTEPRDFGHLKDGWEKAGEAPADPQRKYSDKVKRMTRQGAGP